MKLKKIIVTALFLNIFLLSAQKKGYDIKIQLKNIDETKLYLKGNYGDNYFILDSAKVDNSETFNFKSKNKMVENGIYRLTNNKGDNIIEIIIDQDKNFNIKADYFNLWTNCLIENSIENIAFYFLQRHIRNGNNPNDIINDLILTMPESILTKYAKGQYLTLAMPKYDTVDGKNISLQEYEYYKTHFFDNIDFTDERLLRTPLNFGIDYFFTDIVFQQSDSLIKEIILFLNKCKNNQTVTNYCLSKFYYLFDQHNPEYDIVLVWLYDNYCNSDNCDWLNNFNSRRFKRIVTERRKLLPLKEVPPLTAYGINHQLYSAPDTTKKYTILWFWDPHCEDCLVHTPELYEFYTFFGKEFDLAVFAISISEDYAGWESAISEFPNWINVSYAAGETNYNFVDYFNILTTPEMYLIDNKNRIIARQFPLENLFDFIEN